MKTGTSRMFWLCVFIIIVAFPLVAFQTGHASWYGGKFQGRPTASGELFDTNKLTAAHRTLPFGTHVEVTNLHNGKSVIVRINDRGPFIQGRIIDLSKAAAEQIDMIKSGTAPIRIELIDSTNISDVGDRNSSVNGVPPVDGARSDGSGAADAANGIPGPRAKSSGQPTGPKRTGVVADKTSLSELDIHEPTVPASISMSTGSNEKIPSMGKDAEFTNSSKATDMQPTPVGEDGGTTASGTASARTEETGLSSVSNTSKGEEGSKTAGLNDRTTASPTRSYSIQVGSFAVTSNALQLKRKLESYGFTPAFETGHKGTVRVILPNISQETLEPIKKRLRDAGILDMLIRWN